MFSMSIFLQINESFIYSFSANILRDLGKRGRERESEKEKRSNDVKWQEIDTSDIYPPCKNSTRSRLLISIIQNHSIKLTRR
jgi:hypothetical protein